MLLTSVRSDLLSTVTVFSSDQLETKIFSSFSNIHSDDFPILIYSLTSDASRSTRARESLYSDETIALLWLIILISRGETSPLIVAWCSFFSRSRTSILPELLTTIYSRFSCLV